MAVQNKSRVVLVDNRPFGSLRFAVVQVAAIEVLRYSRSPHRILWMGSSLAAAVPNRHRVNQKHRELVGAEIFEAP